MSESYNLFLIIYNSFLFSFFNAICIYNFHIVVIVCQSINNAGE